MTKLEMQSLIILYESYLKDTVKERTIQMANFEKEGHPIEDVIFKGDFDGFINWLKTKL